MEQEHDAPNPTTLHKHFPAADPSPLPILDIPHKILRDVDLIPGHSAFPEGPGHELPYPLQHPDELYQKFDVLSDFRTSLHEVVYV